MRAALSLLPFPGQVGFMSMKISFPFHSARAKSYRILGNDGFYNLGIGWILT